jgi:hypothetical protein
MRCCASRAPARPGCCSARGHEHHLDTPGSGEDLPGGQLREPGHLMPGAVPSADLGQPVSRAHMVIVRPCRHVAVQQGIGPQRAGGSELRPKLSAKAADISLDPSARMVGHQAHHPPVHTGAAKEARSVQRGETRSVPGRGRTRCHAARRPPPGHPARQLRRYPPCPLGHCSYMPPVPRQCLGEPGLSEGRSVLNAGHSRDRTPGAQPGTGGLWKSLSMASAPVVRTGRSSRR